MTIKQSINQIFIQDKLVKKDSTKSALKDGIYIHSLDGSPGRSKKQKTYCRRSPLIPDTNVQVCTSVYIDTSKDQRDVMLFYQFTEVTNARLTSKDRGWMDVMF